MFLLTQNNSAFRIKRGIFSRKKASSRLDACDMERPVGADFDNGEKFGIISALNTIRCRCIRRKIDSVTVHQRKGLAGIENDRRKMGECMFTGQDDGREVFLGEYGIRRVCLCDVEAAGSGAPQRTHVRTCA